MVLYFTFAFALVGDGEFENAEALFPHRNVRHALTSRRVTTFFPRLGNKFKVGVPRSVYLHLVLGSRVLRGVGRDPANNRQSH